MRIQIEPPMQQWRIAPRDERAPVLATGHQAWLWHPGILAKDMAMDAFARTLASTPSAEGARQPVRQLHLVVDHVAHDTMYLTVPVRQGETLSAMRVQLAPVRTDVPTGCQPPADPQRIIASLEVLARRSDLQCDLDPLCDAAADLGSSHASLAEQMTDLTLRLMTPYVGPVEVLYGTRLLAQIEAQAMVERMVQDARRCVAAYNAAVRAHPEAGIARLSVEPDRLELPLWQLAWERPGQRVYVDLAQPDDPILTLDDGTPIADDQRWLATKALLLTAVMRRIYCDLFIHGTGGGVYDRVMEAWWTGWTGESLDELAPRAIVTADLHLPFDAPIASEADVARAVWFRHHLPHNIDRVLGIDDALAAKKQTLLAHMNDDRDRRRRRTLFDEVHRINASLASAHPSAVSDAEDDVRRARQGLRNAQIARRRDWSFALYPPEALHRLRRAFQDCAVAPAEAAVSPHS